MFIEEPTCSLSIAIISLVEALQTFNHKNLWDVTFGARWLHYLCSTAITLVTVLMNWPPVFHLQWLGHVPHVRQHLPTTIVWNSPVRELIVSVMVSSLLLPTFGTLSLPLYFRLPSTFLPFKRQVYHHLGTRWHDFFYCTF